MRPFLAAVCLVVLAAGPGTAQPTSLAMTAAELRTRVSVLADDSMAGRATGSYGLERATRYVVDEVGRLGLQPAGVGGYLHPVALTRVRSRITASLTRGAGEAPLPVELVLMGGAAGLAGAPRPNGTGPLVDGRGDLAEDAIPRGAALVVRAERLPGALARLAGPRSPLSALLVVTEDTAELAFLRQVARSGEVIPARAPAAGGPPVFALSPGEAGRLLGPARPGGHLSYTVEQSIVPLSAANVVAALPGRDPSRAGEYVVLGAHLDHLGVGAGADPVFNGADDNASGVAVLLEVAERLAALPEEGRPARSVLFVWHTAEEDGLLGSRAFAERPTVPRERMVAMINLDMVGRGPAETLAVIGAERLSSALGNAVDRANASLSRPFRLDRTLDALDHPERLYCRSDHHSYARFSVPVAFLTGGMHPDYHRASDEANRLDYTRLERVSEMVLALVTDLAESPTRPRMDRPLPPIGAPCR